MDELTKLIAEDNLKKANEQYATLEDDIYALRTDIRAQAKLMLEMQLPTIVPFLSRVLELEHLQTLYDEWEA